MGYEFNKMMKIKSTFWFHCFYNKLSLNVVVVKSNQQANLAIFVTSRQVVKQFTCSKGLLIEIEITR